MSSSEIDFVSLGMVVLDELHLPDGKVLQDCVGGSGAYSTLGARIVANRPEAVGSFVMAGRDFPEEVAELIRGWGVAMEMTTDANGRSSTRGLLEYHDADFGRKSFRYLTEPLQPVPSLLSSRMLLSRSFHMLRPPPRVIEEVRDLALLRHGAGVGSRPRPIVVWEPFPSLCTPENLSSHLEAVEAVDVFSPNHLELLGLFGEPASPFNRETIESCSERVFESTAPSAASGSKQYHAVVVRAGEHGCFVKSQQFAFWLPPYHTDSSKVVDATGGGNTFLGAFAITLESTCDLRKAAVAGSVAASFAIEQVGLPERTVDENSGEKWNGDSVQRRLESFDT